MNLEAAKAAFISNLDSMDTCKDRERLLDWVMNNREPLLKGSCCMKNASSTNVIDKKKNKASVVLSCIKTILRDRMPLNATMPSEKIMFPTVGGDVHLNVTNCTHVDAFLYDEKDVDELIERGELANSYCKDCKSTNIEDITFITHSASEKCLEYIFRSFLSTLKGKTVLDVGSRLGVVLYAAHVYSEASEIIGVEINEELCNLQQDILRKFKMTDRCRVLKGDILKFPDVVKKADVIILNNVFEWFMSVDEQKRVWKYLHSIIQSGSFLVTAPSIEQSLELLGMDIDINSWVSELELEKAANEEVELIEDTQLKFYKVL